MAQVEESDFFDIGLPILDIEKENGYISVSGYGSFNGQNFGAVFKFKETLKPFYIFERDENQNLIQHISNPEAVWDDEGSVLWLPEQEGSNFATLLMMSADLEPLEVINTSIAFDTALLFGELEKIPFASFAHNTIERVRFGSANTLGGDFREGQPVPNLLKFKLEYVVTFEPLLRFQLLVSVDFDSGYIFFSEKDLDMREALIPMLKKCA